MRRGGRQQQRRPAIHRRRGWPRHLALSLTVALAAGFAVFAASLPRQATAADFDVRLQDVMRGGGSQSNNLGISVNGVSGTYTGDALRASFNNRTGQPIRVHVPIGLKLLPGNARVQTMVTAGNETIVVPPGKSSVLLKGFCGEQHDGAPGDTDKFRQGGFVDDRLKRVLEEINRRGAYNETGQQSVWHVTDGLDVSQYPETQKLLEDADKHGPVSPKRSAGAGIAAGVIAGGTTLALSGGLGGGGGGGPATDEAPSELPPYPPYVADEPPSLPGGDTAPAEPQPPPGGADGTTPGDAGTSPGVPPDTTRPDMVTELPPLDESAEQTEKAPAEGDKPAESAEGGDEQKAEGGEGEKPAEEGGAEQKPKKDYIEIPTPAEWPGHVLYDPKTGETVVTDGSTEIKKEGKIYTLSQDGKVVVYDDASGNWKVTDARHSVEHEGGRYIVTDDDKVLIVGKDGTVGVYNGHVGVGRSGDQVVVVADGTVIQYEAGSGKYKLDAGYTTIEGEEGKTFAVSSEGKQVITVDHQTGEWKVGNAKHSVESQDGGKRYVLTDDDKLLVVGKDGTAGVVTQNFAIGRADGNKLFVGADGTVLTYEAGPEGSGGKYKLDSGYTTIEGAEGKSFVVSSEGKQVITIDHETNEWKVGDARHSVESQDGGKRYVVTDDDKLLVVGKDGTAGIVTERFAVGRADNKLFVGADGTVVTYEVGADGTGTYKLESGYTTIEGVEGKSFVVSDSGKQIIAVDHETNDWKIGDAKHSFEKLGTTYVVTDDDKVIAFDPKDKTGYVNTGRIGVVRPNGDELMVTDGNVAIRHNHADGTYEVTDGVTTVSGKKGETFVVSKDGTEVINIDKKNKSWSISDGQRMIDKSGDSLIVLDGDRVLSVKKDGTGFLSDGRFSISRPNQNEIIVTQDNKVVEFNREEGTGTISDGHFTVSRPNKDEIIVTKGGAMVQYNRETGMGQVTDGHFVAGRDKEMGYYVGKDDTWIQYNTQSHSGQIVTPAAHIAVAEDRTITVFKDGRLADYNPRTGDATVGVGKVVVAKVDEAYAVAIGDRTLIVDTKMDAAALIKPHEAYLVGEGGAWGVHREIPARVLGRTCTVDLTAGRTPDAGGALRTQWSLVAQDKKGWFAGVSGDPDIDGGIVGRSMRGGTRTFWVQYGQDPRNTWLSEMQSDADAGVTNRSEDRYVTAGFTFGRTRIRR